MRRPICDDRYAMSSFEVEAPVVIVFFSKRDSVFVAVHIGMGMWR